MPSLPTRSCITPKCAGAATRGSRCAQCQASRFKQQDQRRLSPAKRGYDAAHNRLRILAFERDNWTCVDCGWKPDIIRQCAEYDLDAPPLEAILDELRIRKNRNDTHLHGEHDIPIQQRPDLRLELDNYRTRCSVCHSAKTMRELRGEERELSK